MGVEVEHHELAALLSVAVAGEVLERGLPFVELLISLRLLVLVLVPAVVRRLQRHHVASIEPHSAEGGRVLAAQQLRLRLVLRPRVRQVARLSEVVVRVLVAVVLHLVVERLVQRARHLRRLQQLLALVLLADGRLEVQLGVASVELAVQVSLVEQLELARDLGGGDVHLGASAGSLLGRGLGHLILELAVLQLEPVERRHRHVVVPVRVMKVRYFGFAFALVAMLLNAWQDFVGLILLLQVSLVAHSLVYQIRTRHVHLTLGCLSPVLRGPLL